VNKKEKKYHSFFYKKIKLHKALAGSKVKIQGKDVVASYKILSAMVIVPISILIYTLLFYMTI